MDGRKFRAIVGAVCILGDVVSFLFSSALGTEVTWQSVVGHAVVLIVGLLLIDHKLGLEVLQKVLRKAPGRGNDAS